MSRHHSPHGDHFISESPNIKSPSVPALTPLPRCDGPKLSPFGTGEADIDFIKPLGLETNKHSYVWKVRINGKLYALKMFRFFPVSQISDESDDPSDWGGLTRDNFIDYLDPFNCECRAYGQLIAKKREDIVVRVFGYLLLTKAQEEYLRQYYREESGDDHVDIWNRTDPDRGQPVRAIVKELVEGADMFHIEPRAIPKIFRGLTDLHELGILVRDIHEENYLQNRLVDLSMAWTMPHLFLESMDWRNYLYERRADVRGFYDMIQYWNDVHDEDDQIQEPPGFDEYISWDWEHLGKSPCHPLDLEWKKTWDEAKSRR